MSKDGRPDPEQILEALKQADSDKHRGRLKVFLGAAAGVGKTYTMLEAAHQRQADGVEVAAGYVETHGRSETAALLEGLSVIPRRQVQYRGVTLEEMDLDAVLERRPQLVLVDELAHTNAPGSRHPKRYQDVEEVLNKGIDVYTTLNVQHLESLNDVVSQITGVKVHETVPDYVLEQAVEIELVDLPPGELIQRLHEGKVYVAETAERATQRFFRPGNLFALRELALRVAAKRVDRQMREYMAAHGIEGPWPAGERVLVSIGPSPMGERLVRTAARMAANLDAEWSAVFVETPGGRSLSDEQRTRMAQTMRLAEELGGKAVTLAGPDVAGELLHYAKAHNASRIVVGKSLRPGWTNPLQPSIVDRILARGSGLDVHVISTADRGGARRGRRRPPSGPRFSWDLLPWQGYVSATALIAAVTLGGAALSTRIAPTDIVMFYLLAVVASGLRWGRGPAVWASVLSALSFDVFFIPPHFSLTIAGFQYVITFIVLVVVAVVIGSQTGRLADQVSLSRRREAETAALYAFTRTIVASHDAGEIAAALTRHSSETMGCPAAVLLPDGGRLAVASSTLGFDLNEKEMAAAEWSFANGAPAGRGESTLPGVDGRYLPMKTSRGVVGVLALRQDNAQVPLNLSQRLLPEAFASQAAVAVERALLSEEAKKAELAMEADRLHTTLLNSISHDLRTPLSSIIGALTVLTDREAQMDPTTRRDMIDTAREGAERLNRLVGDLLDITRLETGSLKLLWDWCDLEDMVGTVLEQLRPSLQGRDVQVRLEPGLPLVYADYALIAQVLHNLLDNAVKYSAEGTPITLSAERAGDAGDYVVISVADRGPGIPPDVRNRIFGKFFRIDRPGTGRGTGLGLAICKGIVEAHKGRIWVEPREGGGSVFAFSLPLVAVPGGDTGAELE